VAVGLKQQDTAYAGTHRQRHPARVHLVQVAGANPDVVRAAPRPITNSHGAVLTFLIYGPGWVKVRGCVPLVAAFGCWRGAGVQVERPQWSEDERPGC
jgi:hypothetical protein